MSEKNSEQSGRESPEVDENNFYDLRTVRSIEFAEEEDKNEHGSLIMTIRSTTYGKRKLAPEPTPGEPTD